MTDKVKSQIIPEKQEFSVAADKQEYGKCNIGCQ